MAAAAVAVPALGDGGRLPLPTEIAFEHNFRQGIIFTLDVNDPSTLAPFFRRTSPSSEAIWPKWSPDGRQLLFVGAHAIYVAAADGTGVRRVLTTKSIEPPHGIGWAPDGARIVYGSPSHDCSDIYTATLDGRKTRLTSTPGVCEGYPAWSPNGRSIAYVSYQRGNVAAQQEMVMTSAGRKPRLLARSRSLQPLAPAWFPDGTSVTFAADKGLKRLNVATGAASVILTSLGSVESFAWSPDGSMVAVGHAGQGLGPGGHIITVAKPDGSGVRDLSGGPEDHHPDWRPTCTIYGTPGGDVITGTPRDDVICGLGGNDRIAGDGGNDTILGGDGNDVIFGGPGQDTLFGGGGNDVLYATDRERDILDGGPGDDLGYFDRSLDQRLVERERPR